MNRVVNVTEKNINTDSPAVYIIPQNTSIDVLQDINNAGTNIETAARYIQNVGANDVYYAFGVDCNPNTGAATDSGYAKNSQDATHSSIQGVFHGILKSGLQLDCSNHSQKVSVFCSTAGGTSISTTILRRNDMVAHVNIRNQIFPAL